MIVSVVDKLNSLFMMRYDKTRIGYVALGWWIYLWACTIHWITEECKMEAKVNGCLPMIMFNNTTSLEYNSVIMEDDTILYLVKRLANTNCIQRYSTFKIFHWGYKFSKSKSLGATRYFIDSIGKWWFFFRDIGDGVNS